jgi:hypothetical protein
MASNENDLFGAVVTGNIGQLLGAGSLGAILGSLAIIVAALIKRQSPMAALIDARIRTLIEGYEKRINDLQQEIEKLEGKVDTLTKALAEARKDSPCGPPHSLAAKDAYARDQ